MLTARLDPTRTARCENPQPIHRPQSSPDLQRTVQARQDAVDALPIRAVDDGMAPGTTFRRRTSGSPVFTRLDEMAKAKALPSRVDVLLARHKATLETFSGFACSDVRAWPGNIRDPGLRETLFDRDRDLPGPQRLLEAQANGASNKIGTQYTQGQINAAGPLIWHAKSACCTTFAIGAAHVLTGGNPKARLQRGGTVEKPIFTGTGKKSRRDPDGVRVELASVAGTHCLCIVGRDAESQVKGNGRIADPDTWGDDVRIVDPWLGSLGWPTVFKPSEYPYPEWLVDLELNYDSTKPEPKLASPAASLRRREDGGRAAKQTRAMDAALATKSLRRDPVPQDGNALFAAVIKASPAAAARYTDAAGLRARVATYVEAHWGELQDYTSKVSTKAAVVDAIGTDGCAEHPLSQFSPNLVQMALNEDGVAGHLVLEEAGVRGVKANPMGDAGPAIRLARYGVGKVQNNFDPLVTRD